MVKKLSESSQRERLYQVNASDITLTAKTRKRLEALKTRPIDLTDIPETTNWEGAVRGKFYRPIKKQVTIRMDADVLDWFKHAADKYQTLINDACREYMKNHPTLVKD